MGAGGGGISWLESLIIKIINQIRKFAGLNGNKEKSSTRVGGWPSYPSYVDAHGNNGLATHSLQLKEKDRMLKKPSQ